MSPQSSTGKSPYRAAVAALAGTSIEWYDFYAFATAAAIVFNDVFFPPDMSPYLRTLSAFATFAIGFLLRPLGGIVFGHIGDRVGRKKTLVITLVMMGVASFAIGLLPTYAQVGALAPILLIVLRLVQGIAIGGEWGGAVLIAVENAPRGKAAFFGSFAQLGSSVGALLSTGAFSLMNLFGDDAFMSWGWRVPFLASAVLVVVGLIVRVKLEESPVMEEVRKEQEAKAEGAAKLPVVEVLQKAWRTVLIGVFALATATGGYYVVTSFLLSYGTGDLHLSESMLLNGLTLAAFLELLVTPWLSWLADRVGPHKVVIAGLRGRHRPRRTAVHGAGHRQRPPHLADDAGHAPGDVRVVRTHRVDPRRGLRHARPLHRHLPLLPALQHGLRRPRTPRRGLPRGGRGRPLLAMRPSC